MENLILKDADAEVLATLLTQTKHCWGELADAIGKIERDRNWRAIYPSFTRWVRATAKTAGVPESHLWRLLGAKRFYDRVCSETPTASLPSLVDASKSITAEQLELIDKITRSKASAEIVPILNDTLAGKLTREQLRTMWRVIRDTNDLSDEETLYRDPAEKNRGQRGEFNSLAEKFLSIALSNNTNWLGEKSPHFYKAMYRPKFTFPSRQAPADRGFGVDFLVVYQSTPFSAIELHALIGFGMPKQMLPALDAVAAFTDFTWAVTQPNNDEFRMQDRYESELPRHFGILQLTHDEQRIDVIRRPIYDANTAWIGARSGELARTLLVQGG
jgi:hypothetical protein